jgi:hypothetical protein
MQLAFMQFDIDEVVVRKIASVKVSGALWLADRYLPKRRMRRGGRIATGPAFIFSGDWFFRMTRHCRKSLCSLMTVNLSIWIRWFGELVLTLFFAELLSGIRETGASSLAMA